MKDVDTCFWCLKPRDVTETFTKGVDRMVFHGYTPCKTCSELFSKGIHVIGVSKEQPSPGMFPISKSQENDDLYPTGSMFVTSEDWVRRFLYKPEDAPMLEEVLKAKVMLLPDEAVNDIIRMMQEDGTDVLDLVNDNDLLVEQNKGQVVVEETREIKEN